jgi:hypothetical protein
MRKGTTFSVKILNFVSLYIYENKGEESGCFLGSFVALFGS